MSRPRNPPPKGKFNVTLSVRAELKRKESMFKLVCLIIGLINMITGIVAFLFILIVGFGELTALSFLLWVVFFMLILFLTYKVYRWFIAERARYFAAKKNAEV